MKDAEPNAIGGGLPSLEMEGLIWSALRRVQVHSRCSRLVFKGFQSAFAQQMRSMREMRLSRVTTQLIHLCLAVSVTDNTSMIHRSRSLSVLLA
jgi:hypothetical protein